MLYVVGIRFLVNYMKLRPAKSFQKLLVVWNLLLCGLSSIGAAIVLPYLVNSLYVHGLQKTICSEEWFHYPTVVITISAFIFSKIPELMDTVWLALKKREIILLHWYHHLTVLAFCWWAGFHNVGGTGLFFAGINMFVHSVMYGYYALGSMGYRFGFFEVLFVCLCFFSTCFYRPPYPVLITVLQIVQMVIGTYIVYRCIPCANYPSFYISGLIMYSSYFILFTLFFVSRYILPKKPGHVDVRISKDKIY